MDVFTWSLPFVGEKVTDMLISLLNICSKEELEDEQLGAVTPGTSGAAAETEQEQRRKVIKNKILAIGRVSRLFQVLREESESVTELKTVSGSAKLPPGTLMLGSEGIKDAITTFEDARKYDIQNERLPPSREELEKLELEAHRQAVQSAIQSSNPAIEALAKRMSQG